MKTNTEKLVRELSVFEIGYVSGGAAATDSGKVICFPGGGTADAQEQSDLTDARNDRPTGGFLR